MKKVIALLILLMFRLPAFAHAPADIRLVPDFEKSEVNIEIDHSVNNGRTHYIRRVEITPDSGAEMVQNFHFQAGPMLVFSQKVPDLGAVEKVKVKAYCKKGGVLTREFDIKSMREALPKEEDK